MLWYSINIFIILIFLALWVVFKKSDKNWTGINEYLGLIANTINSIRYGNLTAKVEKSEDPKYKNLTESINRMVETLNDREKMIVEYQNELTRQNRFLEAVINSLSDGILVVDENYKILRVTPKIGDWFVQNGIELLHQNASEYIQPKENIVIENLDESEIFIKNNSSSYFEASTVPLNLNDGTKRFVIIIKDTTNQKELEKLREDFVATLTHDLKVPIVAEANILDFLINGKFGEMNDRQQEAVANMKDSNLELLELVQILLETYKVKDAGIELQKSCINLIHFISSIIEEMQPIAEKAGFHINFNPQEDFQVVADNVQLKRVVKNLIQNAISHSESNKDINIKLNRADDFINIVIIDYGKGIPKENLEKIFNKYYSTAQKFRKIGTGLGLYLSQQIIKSHGGEITVKSEENQGTEFCIRLPGG